MGGLASASKGRFVGTFRTVSPGQYLPFANDRYVLPNFALCLR